MDTFGWSVQSNAIWPFNIIVLNTNLLWDNSDAIIHETYCYYYE